MSMIRTSTLSLVATLLIPDATSALAASSEADFKAAYAAAEDQRAMSMADLIRATQREYLKMGLLTVESEFGPYYQLLNDR